MAGENVTFVFIDTTNATVDRQNGQIETILPGEIFFEQGSCGEIALISYSANSKRPSTALNIKGYLTCNEAERVVMGSQTEKVFCALLLPYTPFIECRYIRCWLLGSECLPSGQGRSGNIRHPPDMCAAVEKTTGPKHLPPYSQHHRWEGEPDQHS